MQYKISRYRETVPRRQTSCRILYIKKKPALIFIAVVFLMLFGILSIRVALIPTQPVISYVISGHVIAVDAGHGGIDPGAVSPDKHKEKDITLAISKKLVRYLNQAGAKAINLRTSNQDLCGANFKGSIRERKRHDLALRVQRAQSAKADIYISIHANADISPRWSGAQTFYKNGQEESKVVAIAIQKELIRILGNNKREAKTGRYYILDHAKMPIVIVEVGFLSNPQEAKLLISEDYQDKIAYAIFSGIVKSYLPEEKASHK